MRLLFGQRALLLHMVYLVNLDERVNDVEYLWLLAQLLVLLVTAEWRFSLGRTLGKNCVENVFANLLRKKLGRQYLSIKCSNLMTK